MVISSRDLVVLEYLLLITEKTINCRLQLSKPYIWHNVSKYRRLCLSSEQLLSRARLKGFMLQPCQWKKQIWAHVRKKRNTTANSHCLSIFLFLLEFCYMSFPWENSLLKLLRVLTIHWTAEPTDWSRNVCRSTWS